MNKSSIGCLMLLATLIALGIPTSADADALDSKAIKKGVEKYVDPATSATARESLLGVLARAKNADVSKALKSSFRKEESRTYALDLALALHLRGLFSSTKKYLDEEPSRVSNLGLITNDKGAHKALQNAWAEAELDSDTCVALTDSFTKYGANMDALEGFISVLEDESAVQKRRQAAAEIMAAQMGLTTKDPTEISLLWEAFKSSYGDEGKCFDVEGLNPLEIAGFECERAKHVGLNWKIVDSGRIGSSWPEYLLEPSYTVSVWVRVSSDYEGAIGLNTGVPGGRRILLGPRYGEGKLTVQSVNEVLESAIKPDKWTHITWTITTAVKSGGGAGQAWGVAMDVDGLRTAENMQIHEEPRGFEVTTNKGSCIVSSIDYVRQ